MDSFSSDYYEARAKFRTACLTQGIVTQSFRHPLTGPGGVELTTDIGYAGDADASNLLERDDV